MAQTPRSGADPYCSVADLFAYRDSRQVLQLILDDDTQADASDAADPEEAAGATLLAILAAASGQVEEYCLRGERYVPADLEALTGNSLARLKELTANLAFWKLSKRRWPQMRAEECAGAEEALADLKRLGDGETLFGLIETAKAADQPATTTLSLGGANTIVSVANRFFGRRNQGC